LKSTSGSKSRLLNAIHAFYGLNSSQLINPESQLTVKEFVEGIVRDRSRILHGTWSTLRHSLRDSRPNLTILVSELLARYTLALDRYASTTGAKDDIESFLIAVNKFREEDN
jgi:hypothetical protein